MTGGEEMARSCSTSLAPLIAGARLGRAALHLRGINKTPRDPAAPRPRGSRGPGHTGKVSRGKVSRLSIHVFKRDTQPFAFCVCVQVWVSRMPGSATRCPSGPETLTPHPTLQQWLLTAGSCFPLWGLGR